MKTNVAAEILIANQAERERVAVPAARRRLVDERGLSAALALAT